MEPTRAGGPREENFAVKSISVLSSTVESEQTRLLFVSDGGECGRLDVCSGVSSVMLLISKASSMHWHLVSLLQLPHVNELWFKSSISCLSVMTLYESFDC